jgi:fumarate hydratase subunit beta
MNTKAIRAPLDPAEAARLRSGDSVSLSGVIYAARDAAHKRLVEMIERGEPLPFDPARQVLYYAGPAPAGPGKVIGPIGPTSSYRMDAYTVPLLEKGLGGMIGKGSRSGPVVEAIRKHGAVYFAATGGAAALIARCVKRAEVVAFPDLGPEAVFRLEIEDLPLVVINDVRGGDWYAEGRKRNAVSPP